MIATFLQRIDAREGVTIPHVLPHELSGFGEDLTPVEQ